MVHAGRRAFAVARQRDYELLVSGYAVLRLAHEEIVANPGSALEKVRDVVRYRTPGARKEPR